MKTQAFHKKIADLIPDDHESPLPIGVIPNYMGINLCAVDGISWIRQEDRQLVSLTIHFIPAPHSVMRKARAKKRARAARKTARKK